MCLGKNAIWILDKRDKIKKTQKQTNKQTKKKPKKTDKDN